MKCREITTLILGWLTSEVKLAKNRWFAVFLNLFLYGLGYVYLDRRKAFGIILFVGNIAFYLAFVYSFIMPLPQTTLTYININSIGFAAIGLAFAYDAWQLAKESQLVRSSEDGRPPPF